jgi:hypothetical protein
MGRSTRIADPLPDSVSNRRAENAINILQELERHIHIQSADRGILPAKEKRKCFISSFKRVTL